MDWMKYRKIYFAISLIVVGVGIFSLLRWGLPLGVDFTGGTIAEYKFEKEIPTEELSRKLNENGIETSSIQSTGENQYLFRTKALSSEDKGKFKTLLGEEIKDNKFEELRFESVGPAIGPELVKKTIYAIIVSALAILLWVAIQFKSLKFG